MATDRLRRLVVDSPRSLGGRARARRWEWFLAHFPDVQSMRVIDLGGTVNAWQTAPVRPAELTIINLYEPGHSTEKRIIPLMGDACRAREVLLESKFSTDFDLAFSNSLIEHLGGHANRLKFAQSVMSLAPRHWVQTPYRYFPLEPHWLFPGMQFLPIAARVQIAAHWPLSHTRPESLSAAQNDVFWTELLSGTEMLSLFPSSTILKERFAGITKSLIAVR